MENKFVLRFLVNVSIIIGILLSSISYEITKSKDYLDSTFSRFARTLQEIAEDNASDAQYAQSVLENQYDIDINLNGLNSDDIHYYADRNEYGFNQGVYPSVAANGTLIGYGKPPVEILENSKRFLIVDKIWNNFRKANLFHNHFVTNYKYQYVYTSNIRNHSSRVRFLTDGLISPERFRAGLESHYEKDLEKAGYFFTLPYPNLLGNTDVFSVMTPLYSKGVHFADMGTDLTLNDLQNIIHLYPDIKKSVQVNFLFHHSEVFVPVSNAKYSFLGVFDYQYDISYVGQLIANYDVSYFVIQLFPLLCVLILLSVIFHIGWAYNQMNNKEKIKLREQLTHDSMTGLYNRRILDEQVIGIIDEFNHNKSPVCVIAIDANKFKEINDTHGHQVGDKAIQHIANCLKLYTRSVDFCIRMGGDEFLVVLPNLDIDKSESISERLSIVVKSRAIDDVGVNVSIATAVAQMLPNETFDELYKRVDDLLYNQKMSD
ncbi:GGDEF domain-containing protein [Vibrio sp. S17_S38]|uniref:GGDEF domain-containing protein n=1 Tax=Vibrio sp. S17_S38 TaxID=2720229 RepID=UPI001680C757|nr:GGDEF domain-containing protein [Vibrio sp. S17_S38]MBD1574165.1 GGDEF domain-containing protein [Vibrio sp. S17_S38]